MTTVNIALGAEFTLAGTDGMSVRARPIHVHPTQQYVAHGDPIEFSLKQDDGITFTVVFPDGSPFVTDEIHSRGALTSQELTVVGGKDKRPYHYYVAVATKKDIYLIASCPEIIIR
jgi:hypothetical protein